MSKWTDQVLKVLEPSAKCVAVIANQVLYEAGKDMYLVFLLAQNQLIVHSQMSGSLFPKLACRVARSSLPLTSSSTLLGDAVHTSSF